MRRDVPGHLVLERRLLTFPRGLLAAVLLFLAWFPLDYLWRSWRYFGAVATLEEWRQAYPGFALVALAAVVPVAIAWVLLLRRRSVVLHLSERRLTAVRDDRVLTRRWHHTFADVLRVSVTRLHSRKTPVTFPVTIVMRNGSEVEVSDAPGKAQALRTAALVAAELGVEVSSETSA